jgi:hypothetical protein
MNEEGRTAKKRRTNSSDKNRRRKSTKKINEEDPRLSNRPVQATFRTPLTLQMVFRAPSL